MAPAPRSSTTDRLGVPAPTAPTPLHLEASCLLPLLVPAPPLCSSGLHQGTPVVFQAHRGEPLASGSARPPPVALTLHRPAFPPPPGRPLASSLRTRTRDSPWDGEQAGPRGWPQEWGPTCPSSPGPPPGWERQSRGFSLPSRGAHSCLCSPTPSPPGPSTSASDRGDGSQTQVWGRVAGPACFRAGAAEARG